ncbi:hypothetical protein DMN91_012706 [Ooceraea biroi]|uniref:ISXO2-like transposase domain-containing protein n=1 Tax=Ooceraea biroi TaxID=2015173 RepID=A0A3L8D3J9_OOCBI|nr:hypothetical protein DMN91_012706 [Ooceraea biroi]
MMQPPRHRFLMQQLEMSSKSVVDWTNFCRELLAQWVENDRKLLGGPEIIVEVDEAKSGRRKYNRGRVIRGQWIFGTTERNSNRIFVIPIEDRSAATLTTIIRQHIAPGTIIHSDSWKGYTGLTEFNYIHRTVNHSQNFVDPTMGVHTQNIERLWRDMRAALPRFGTSQNHYMHYLAEFVFKKQYSFNE